MNAELIGYIKESFKAGADREEVIANLNSAGWQLSDIENAFIELERQEEQESGTYASPKGTRFISGKTLIAGIVAVAAFLGVAAWLAYIIVSQGAL